MLTGVGLSTSNALQLVEGRSCGGPGAKFGNLTSALLAAQLYHLHVGCLQLIHMDSLLKKLDLRIRLMSHDRERRWRGNTRNQTTTYNQTGSTDNQTYGFGIPDVGVPGLNYSVGRRLLAQVFR